MSTYICMGNSITRNSLHDTGQRQKKENTGLLGFENEKVPSVSVSILFLLLALWLPTYYILQSSFHHYCVASRNAMGLFSFCWNVLFNVFLLRWSLFCSDY